MIVRYGDGGECNVGGGDGGGGDGHSDLAITRSM